MADMLNTSLSALVSYQQALTTTSHNISNANTEGYSRQRVDFSTRIPDLSGVGAIGSGVQTEAIRRVFDQSINDQVQGGTASYNQQDTIYVLSAQVQTLLSDSNTGLDSAMSQFFNTLQGVVNDPSSQSARRVLLDDARALVNRFNDLDSQFTALDQTLNTQVRTSVNDINGLTSRIAALNGDISRALTQAGNSPPNDLMDQRDQALVALNKLVRVSTSGQGDGSLNVYTGSGQPLVLAGVASTLSVAAGEFNPLQARVMIQGNVDLTDSLQGGVLGGTLAFRRDVLDPVRGQLGLIGRSLADQFNTQHRLGGDLTGQPGGDFFTVPAPRSQPSSENSGTATVSTGIADLAQITGRDYRLRYDGSSWRLFSQPDEQPVIMAGAGTAASPFTAEGLSITVSAGAQAGDEFQLLPAATVPGGLQLAISDPVHIAAAASGGAVGDNRNALALAAVENRKTLIGGTASLQDQMRSMLSQVASSTRQAEVNRQSQSMLLDQATSRRDSVSGVNLDEEAANLMRFQQAYQAAAQAISVSNTIFETMISAFRS